MISIDDFRKINLIIAEINGAERIPKTDKLVRLTVDTGGEKRTIVAGIAQHYTTDDLVGKQIVLVENLEPVKLRGVESRGMLLAARDADSESVVLLNPETNVPPGSSVS